MKIPYLISFVMLLSCSVFAETESQLEFKSHVSTVPKDIAAQMTHYTLHQGCPIEIKDLAYIQLTYWGFDNKTHYGSLIVNQDLSLEIVDIFKTLYLQKFPIRRMELMDAFKGNDNASMLANNTSAFNCRKVTARPGEYSQHSYGRAIDINPLINPYVNKGKIMPSESTLYANRLKSAPGKIIKGDRVYQAFIEHGWDWGGDWYDVQDYQHFEKRAGGEKRNPNGYDK